MTNDAHYTDAELESDRRSHQDDMDDAWAEDEAEWDASQRCQGDDCANPDCDGNVSTGICTYCNDCFATIEEAADDVVGMGQSSKLESIDNPEQYL